MTQVTTKKSRVDFNQLLRHPALPGVIQSKTSAAFSFSKLRMHDCIWRNIVTTLLSEKHCTAPVSTKRKTDAPAIHPTIRPALQNRCNPTKAPTLTKNATQGCNK
jgi:hypothetical protein